MLQKSHHNYTPSRELRQLLARKAVLIGRLPVEEAGQYEAGECGKAYKKASLRALVKKKRK
jgi:hypothetical protein